MKYKHSCSTMEVLLWESELTAKPRERLISMPAAKGDLAWVNETQKEYGFNGTTWVPNEHTDKKEYEFNGNAWIVVDK